MPSSQSPSDNPKSSGPVFLTPPGGTPRPKNSSWLPGVLITLGLGLLLLLVILVVVYLPGKTPTRPIADLETAQPAADKHSGPSLPDPGRSEAEELLGNWLRHRAQAEAENISAWAPEKYAGLLQTAAEADRLLAKKQFTRAQDLYQQATRNLAEILAAKTDILADAIEQGRQSLAEEDSTGATKAFARALAIDPQNKEALAGKHRAGNLDQVAKLYRDALQREKEGELSEALTLLEKALALDKAYTPTREAQARVEGRFEKLRFREIMGRALAALDRQDQDAAEAALAEASGLRQGDATVAKAKARLVRLKKNLQLKELRDKAEEAANREQWSDALRIYTRALAVDAQATFAVNGKSEAEKRLKLDTRITSILENPARLQEKGPLQDARQVLSLALSIDEPGPVLSNQVENLSRLVADASKLIEVILRSDGMTEVEIYRVGRLQPFREYSLSLRPGTYTVVGRRPGYRDIRKTLTLTAEQADRQQIFPIRCEEPI